MTDTLDKEEFAEELAEHIVRNYDMDSLIAIVWDLTYGELLNMSWEDLRMTAEEHGLTPKEQDGFPHLPFP
jgi:hypothetical protein